jgi:hypothetical protein
VPRLEDRTEIHTAAFEVPPVSRAQKAEALLYVVSIIVHLVGIGLRIAP